MRVSSMALDKMSGGLQSCLVWGGRFFSRRHNFGLVALRQANGASRFQHLRPSAGADGWADLVQGNFDRRVILPNTRWTSSGNATSIAAHQSQRAGRKQWVSSPSVCRNPRSS
jgi:hypothetical protein